MKIGSVEVPLMESVTENDDFNLKGDHTYANFAVPKNWKKFLKRMENAGKDPEGVGVVMELDIGLLNGGQTAVVFYPDTYGQSRPRAGEILASGEGFGFIATPEMLREIRNMIDTALEQK